MPLRTIGLDERTMETMVFGACDRVYVVVADDVELDESCEDDCTISNEALAHYLELWNKLYESTMYGIGDAR